MFNVTLNKPSKINNGKPNLKFENYDLFMCPFTSQKLLDVSKTESAKTDLPDKNGH